MAGKKSFVLAILLSFRFVCMAGVIPAQNGVSIFCDGASFVYNYVPSVEGVDDHPNLSGDIGFISETPGASFFTDTSLRGSTAKVQYTLTTAAGLYFDDITVNSRASIYNNEGIVTGHYRVDGGEWVLFFTTHRHYQEDLRQEDTFEDVGGQTFEILYTINRDTTSYWTDEVAVQLFRSTGASDYTFSISGTTIPEPTSLLLLGLGGVIFGRKSKGTVF